MPSGSSFGSKEAGFFATPAWKKTALGSPIDLYSSGPLEKLHGKRPILLMGGIHGDEPEGVRLAEDTLKWLESCSLANSRPDAASNHQPTQDLTPWILIPCLNVDGYKKNQRVNGRGVDLNRNYPSRDWSPAYDKDRYYPGPSPASEPEIQAVVELIQVYQPRLIIHCHSWEPCIVGTGERSKLDAERLGQNSGYRVTGEIGYPTPGSLSRYGWHDHQIPVICIEEQEHLNDLNTIWPRFQRAMREIFSDPSLRTSQERPFDHLIFDLDDTLLDTSKYLIPQATREACTVMINAGLNCTLDECISARQDFARHKLGDPKSQKNFFETVVEHYGTRDNKDAETVSRLGYEAFHNRKVEEDIALFPGVRDVLRDLRSIYNIHLVTAGHRPTQESKIRVLGIDSLFVSISHVDLSRGEIKQSAFEKIMTSTGAPAHRHLSIGNRLDTDIADAKRIGWTTCWVRHGEYAERQPQNELEKPDFEIQKIEDLVSECRL